jgi:cysteine sulfinate desulfinase/cysteine desulfurase-like protein/rhodanese-related sulfurtransferase
MSIMSEIYLDQNATTPVLPQALEAACLAMASSYGNPSSTHACGLRAKTLLDEARQRAKRVIGAGQGQLIFTSGATESIQLAVLSTLTELRRRRFSSAPPGSLLLHGATEHKAVQESLAHWNQVLGLGCRVLSIPVDAQGRHDLDFLRAHAADAAMVCTMAVNNETGAISDLAGIEKVLLESGSAALWLVDAVQALGKIQLNLQNTRIDYASFSGHKLYAPKGVGMLYARAGAPFTPMMAGGGQEFALRSGTENMSGIAAFNAVLKLLEEQDPVFQPEDTLYEFRQMLATALEEAFPGIVFNTPLDNAVPTTLNFSVPGISSKEMLNLFDSAGIRVSTGSACSSANAAPSFVLRAMQVPDEYARAAIRMSFGPASTQEEIAQAAARIAQCGAAARSAHGLAAGDAQAAAHDGLLRLEANGECSWMLSDAASRRCVIIDPVSSLNEKLSRLVRSQGFQVQAILQSELGSDTPSAKAAADLAAMLEQHMAPPAAPGSVRLANGSQAEAIPLGHMTVARISLPGNACCYLAGAAEGGTLAGEAVHYVFTGKAVPLAAAEQSPGSRDLLQALSTLAHAHSLLCPSHDAQSVQFSSLRAESADADHARDNEDIHIQADTIRHLLHDRPDTLLIDVREAYEHSFLEPGLFESPLMNVPLPTLAGRAAAWLHDEETPMIFFCRSGARSDIAARCMRRLGYREVWSCAGGLG